MSVRMVGEREEEGEGEDEGGEVMADGPGCDVDTGCIVTQVRITLAKLE